MSEIDDLKRENKLLREALTSIASEPECYNNDYFGNGECATGAYPFWCSRCIAEAALEGSDAWKRASESEGVES